MRHHEYLSEDELFEINMSPKNLTKLVKDIPGAKLGLEFEMIVTDANIDDEDDFQDEADYDYNERTGSIGNIVDFFCHQGDGSDFNSERRLRAKLDEAYNEWLSEAESEAWNDQEDERVREYITEETDIHREAVAEYMEEHPDAHELDAEKHADTVLEKAIETAINEGHDNPYYERAHDWFSESFYDEDHQDDWLRAEGYTYMTDIEGIFDETYWPYRTSLSSDGETDLEGIADSFGAFVGRPTQYASSYHSSSIDRSRQAREGFYIIEKDGSLQPDDEDSEAGLEFVSPPLSLPDMMSEVKKVAEWAQQRGAYTGKNNKTGLHMNVSVPNYSKDNLDFVKLALLLGDVHVLEEFDRLIVRGTNYAESSFNLLAKNLKANPDKAQAAMEKMRDHFDLAASKAIHSGRTDKFTSINVKDNRVEFRSPGGDYLALFHSNPNKLFGPMMRFVVALDAACDPEKYKEEYQKKLYKFLSAAVPGKQDVIDLFSDYAAGKGMPRSAMKAFLKHRNQDRQLRKPGEGVTVGGRRSNPDGEWTLFRQHSNGNTIRPFDVEVLYRFNAADNNDAQVVHDQYIQEYKPGFQVMKGYDPEKKYGQPGDYVPKTKKAVDDVKGNWAVYRISDGVRMKAHGEYILFDNVTKIEAREQLEELMRTHENSSRLLNIDQFELRREPITYIIRDLDRQYNASSFEAFSDTEAAAEFRRAWGTDPRFELRRTDGSVVEPSEDDTQAQAQEQQWAIYDINDGRVVHVFTDTHNNAHANGLRWLRDNNYPYPVFNYRVRPAAEGEQATPRPGTNATPSRYELYRISDGRTVRTNNGDLTFLATDQDDAESKIARIASDFNLGAPQIFGVRSVLNVPQHTTTTTPPSTRSNGEFTGYWKIVDSTGRELHRFNGIGNNQRDANRVAHLWLMDQGSDVPRTGNVEVLPVMGEA